MSRSGGSNSVEEFLPSKQAVAGSNPVSRYSLNIRQRRRRTRRRLFCCLPRHSMSTWYIRVRDNTIWTNLNAIS